MFVPLMYHLVDARIDHPMSVPEDSFRRQLDWLGDNGIPVLTPDRALAAAEPEHTRQAPSPGVLLTFDDGYLNTVTTVRPLLDERGLSAVMAVCGSYLDPATLPDHIPHASQEFASAGDVRDWLAAGHAIAGHSYTHPRLTGLPREELEAEIDLDLRAIESATGHRPATFCYPFGKSDQAVREVVGRFYRHAFVTDGGSWPHPAHPLAMRRLQVRPEWDVDAFGTEVVRALAACVEPEDANRSTNVRSS
ncbi:polysaccharide deacetylase family protein [Streptomyces sp. NPDC057249]|uniref:polysaccharide deacetylase family protein n=1 Tax=Streptomyces sp. NPDC057249 TaxID=3346067 RepID=UPI003633B740